MRTRRGMAGTAVVLSLLATACAGSSSNDNKQGQGHATTTVAAEQPVRGGTLVVGIDADPGNLNPAVTSNGGVHTAAEPMFNGLVGLDRDGKPTPELAASWTIEQNGAVYRFVLRDGVKWHDGQAFTSDDVKFTFEKALLPFHSRTRASMTAAGVKVDAPDPKTVVFTFSAPYAPLLQQLNVTEAPIIPRHVYESCADISTVAGCPANKAPVGTGPFKFASYDPTEIKMVRNPDYFRPGLPYLDGLTERVIAPTAATRTPALQRHEVDWLWSVPGTDLSLLRADKGVTLADAARGPGGGNCVLTIAFDLKPGNDHLPFFADLRTRQALWLATDRQKAADQVLFGQGRVSAQPIDSAIAVARSTGLTLPATDVARAKQLLDAAGWKDDPSGTRVARGVPGVPDGTPFKIDFHGFAGQQTDFGAILKQQWKAVGVDLDTKTDSTTDLPVAVFTNRQFDTAAISYCNEADPQIGVRRQYHSSQISTMAFTNAAAYNNADMDKLWDQSAAEVDPGKRQALFQQIQTLAVRDLPYIWMAETVNTRGYNSACTGFNLRNTGLFAEAAYCKR